MAIEASAALACLITSAKSTFGFFNASSIADTVALTFATASSVFGKPTDLTKYSPRDEEIADNFWRFSLAFL